MFFFNIDIDNLIGILRFFGEKITYLVDYWKKKKKLQKKTKFPFEIKN
jgi:hypothetical protein